MTASIIDIGCNLTSKQFRRDCDEVIARARHAGVAQMIVTGLSAPVSWAASELASRYPGVLFSTAGVHPHNAGRASATCFDDLRAILRKRHVVAAGEMGLDYNRNFSPRDVQRRVFISQLRLAAEAGKPVFLHEREAHDDFYAIIREHRPMLAGGVVHCFTSNRQALERYLCIGLHIGITGMLCDQRRGRHLRELVAQIPSNRLMIETDAPFLLPRDLGERANGGSRRNEPMWLPHILEQVALARGETAASLAQSSTRAARELFNLDAGGEQLVSPHIGGSGPEART